MSDGMTCLYYILINGSMAYLIHGQLDFSSERHQGTDDSQDPEQEEKHRGTAASYSFQLDDA